MLLWRFRWSLVGEPRALTRVLRCVDWADVRDARAAAELIARWAPIGIADALELLSPAFTNPEVRPCPYTHQASGCSSIIIWRLCGSVCMSTGLLMPGLCGCPWHFCTAERDMLLGQALCSCPCSGYGHLKQFTAWGRSCSRKASAVSQIPMPKQCLQNNAWAAVEAALRSRSHLEPHQRFLLCLLSHAPVILLLQILATGLP